MQGASLHDIASGEDVRFLNLEEEWDYPTWLQLTKPDTMLMFDT
jgi:hypothetical protein